jgi:hypothetical protein
MSAEFYFLLKLAHLLLFVYWLGADIGVFYSARFVRNASLDIASRRTAMQILAWIDQIPRYCLVLMLPVGYSLAAMLGLVRMPAIGFVVLWGISAAWLWMVWAIHHYQGKPIAEKLRRIDLIWRWVLLAGLLWDAYTGLQGTGHIFADWVAIKFLLFAAMLFCGIMIRLRGKALGPALREILSNGSTPALEATVAGAFAKTRPFVLSIWVLLIIAAWVGIAKPAIGD